MGGKLFLLLLLGCCGVLGYGYGDRIGEEGGFYGRRDYSEKEGNGREDYRGIEESKGKESGGEKDEYEGRGGFGGIGEYKDKEEYHKIGVYDEKRKEEDDKVKCEDKDNCGEDKDYNYDERYFYEPCDFADDLDCVRHFFAKHSKCSIVDHEYKGHVYRERFTDFFVGMNLTFITTRTRVKAEDGKIQRFYVDKKTNNLVMSVDFKDLSVDSKLAFFVVSRRGREPAVAADFAKGGYPGTLTAVIPLKDGISLKDSRVTAFIPEKDVRFVIGPKVTKSKDPAIQKAIAGIFTNTQAAILEFYLTEAPNFFLVYLQKNICDFGIPYSA